MGEEIRIGLVGAGMMGREHIRNLPGRNLYRRDRLWDRFRIGVEMDHLLAIHEQCAEYRGVRLHAGLQHARGGVRHR